MLTKEQITKELPELSVHNTNVQLAKHFGVTKWTIEYWLRTLRKKGYDLPKRKTSGRKSRI